MAFTTTRLNAAIDAAATGVTHAQLHTGDPGASGTSNVAAGVNRATLTGVGSASGAADSWTCTFTIPAAGGPFTHVSFWTASTSGTHMGNAALTPNETFAAAGTYAVTANVAGT